MDLNNNEVHYPPINWLEYNKTTTNKLVISIAGGVE